MFTPPRRFTIVEANAWHSGAAAPTKAPTPIDLERNTLRSKPSFIFVLQSSTKTDIVQKQSLRQKSVIRQMTGVITELFEDFVRTGSHHPWILLDTIFRNFWRQD